MRQSTPHDQLIAVVSSLEGNLSNFKEGIVHDETFIKRVEGLIATLKEIIPHTADACWKVSVPTVPHGVRQLTGFEADDGPPTTEWLLRPRR
jgi:hypothetical protein